MDYSIVLGTQFGDEGKGSFTDHLCKINSRPLVVRFNGGHQAGHTVLNNNIRHTFSTFGSGTFQNIPTYYSRFCTIYPIAVLNEYEALKNIGINPTIFFDPLCPITTPYDIISNIKKEAIQNHGSVGVGFGTTISRQEAFYKLYYQDIFNKTVLNAKINNIKNYYNIKVDNDLLLHWYDSIDKLIEYGIFSKDTIGFDNLNEKIGYNHVIFEGAQGILLDMDFGFFPNVTHSNTTSKNVFTLISELPFGIRMDYGAVYYITRTYQTRHGMGFMSNRNYEEPKLVNNENEININTGFQGIFRKSILDIDLIDYAIASDNNFSKNCLHKIVLTCLDQIESNIQYTINNKLYTSSKDIFIDKFGKIFNMSIIKGINEGVFLNK